MENKLNIDENCEEQLRIALEEATGTEFEYITIDTFKNLIYKKLDEYCENNKCNMLCKKKDCSDKKLCLIKGFIDNLTKDV